MAALKQTAESRTEVDALTGLPPYGAFVRRVGELGRRGAKGKVASLALFDLDGFGRINEQAGHDEGDAIIRRLAETVLETAGAGAEVFRYGGGRHQRAAARDGEGGCVSADRGLSTGI